MKDKFIVFFAVILLLLFNTNSYCQGDLNKIVGLWKNIENSNIESQNINTGETTNLNTEYLIYFKDEFVYEIIVDEESGYAVKGYMYNYLKDKNIKLLKDSIILIGDGEDKMEYHKVVFTKYYSDMILSADKFGIREEEKLEDKKPITSYVFGIILILSSFFIIIKGIVTDKNNNNPLGADYENSKVYIFSGMLFFIGLILILR